jgi:hypothetical protein
MSALVTLFSICYEVIKPFVCDVDAFIGATTSEMQIFLILVSL